LKVPVIIERALHHGSVVLLLAGIHEDEPNGVGIIRKIIDLGISKPSNGTIICIPVLISSDI